MAIVFFFVLRLARGVRISCFLLCVLVLLKCPGNHIGVVGVVVDVAARAAACKSVRI